MVKIETSTENLKVIPKVTSVNGDWFDVIDGPDPDKATFAGVKDQSCTGPRPRAGPIDSVDSLLLASLHLLC